MTNKSIHQYGTKTRFSSTNQPSKNGRKVSRISQICEEFEIEYNQKVSKSDVKKLLEFLSFATASDLKKMLANPHIPILITSYIRALFADMKAGKINAVKDIIEFSFGSPIKRLEAENNKAPVTQLVDRDAILRTMRRFCEVLNLDDLEMFREIFEEVVASKKNGITKVIS